MDNQSMDQTLNQMSPTNWFKRSVAKKHSLTLSLMALLAGFVSTHSFAAFKLWHPKIEQGNRLDPKKISALKLGMTRAEVIACMGETSLLNTPFSPERLTYVHFYVQGEAISGIERLTVTFDQQGKAIAIDLSESLQASMGNTKQPDQPDNQQSSDAATTE